MNRKSLLDRIIRSDRPDYPVRAGLSDLTGRIIRSEKSKIYFCSIFTPQGLKYDWLVLLVGYPMLFHLLGLCVLILYAFLHIFTSQVVQVARPRNLVLVLVLC